MSVVAGCSLLDGVLLAADCRVTFEVSPKQFYYTDNAQKLFTCTPRLSIGFVGDVKIASDLLLSLSKYQKKGRQHDPISLILWLQRKFRFEYAKRTSTWGMPKPQVIFMLAGALRGRPTIVPKKSIAELLFHIAQGSVKQSWVPSHLVNLLDVPREYTHVAIPDTARGILCVMRSPDFNLECQEPLTAVTIGSGDTLSEEISDVRGVLFGGADGDEIQWMRRSISNFIRNKNIPSVGGLFPLLRITGKGTAFIPQDTTKIDHGKFGEHVRLVYEQDAWKQKNLTTGKEMVLLPPWKIKTPAGSNKFDDLRGF
jgi:hypothetical protein